MTLEEKYNNISIINYNLIDNVLVYIIKAFNININEYSRTDTCEFYDSYGNQYKQLEVVAEKVTFNDVEYNKRVINGIDINNVKHKFVDINEYEGYSTMTGYAKDSNFYVEFISYPDFNIITLITLTPMCKRYVLEKKFPDIASKDYVKEYTDLNCASKLKYNPSPTTIDNGVWKFNGKIDNETSAGVIGQLIQDSLSNSFYGIDFMNGVIKCMTSGYEYIEVYNPINRTGLAFKNNVLDETYYLEFDNSYSSILDSIKNVTNKYEYIEYAILDENGKIPSSQLPSYVDDVLEYTSLSQFPQTGESGKIYLDTTANISYRWGGSQYVEISSSLALGETASTAYAGDKGKANADAISLLQSGKVDKVNGKQLSTEDYTSKEKTKLAGLSNYDDTKVKQDIVNLETNKANSSDVYNKTETYSSTEIDTMIGDIESILDTLNGVM